MNNKTALLFLAGIVFIVLLISLNSRENLEEDCKDCQNKYNKCIIDNQNNITALESCKDILCSPDCPAKCNPGIAECPNKTDTSSPTLNVDCSKTPNAPACQQQCSQDSDCQDPQLNVCVNGKCVTPVNTGLLTCVPTDGQWSKPNVGKFSRSGLNSPCCQPPDYPLASSYTTCDNIDDETNPSIKKCLSDCCKYANNQANMMDPSWYSMARCGCSLWCNNAKVPHFSKYGTAVHYISGDIAEAQTSDSANFIKN